jgi:hypothetical protein
MNELLLYKNPFIFDRIHELGLDCTEALCMYQVGFLGFTGSGINRIDPGIFRISPTSIIPNYRITQSFSDIMYARAEELVKKHNSFKIRWTGVCCAAILKVLSPLTNNIEILSNKDHVVLIPDEFKHLKVTIVDDIKFISSEIFDKTFISDVCCMCLLSHVLRGWKIGNYTSDAKNINGGVDLYRETIKTMNIGKRYANAYKDCVQINKFYNNTTQAYNNIYNYFGKMIDQSPVAIKSSFDLYWWIRFCMQWNANRWQYLGLTGKNNNTVDFFDHNDFQVWSIQNHETKGRHTLVDFLGYDILKFNTSKMNLVELGNRKTTWKISFADSEGNTAIEPFAVTKEMVQGVIK